MRDFVEIILGDLQLTFLVDTQADNSIIKIGSIFNKNSINYNEKIWLKGITDEGIESIGTIHCNLTVGQMEIKTKFHVVSEDFPIPSNGLLGKDFIYSNLFKLDYGDMTFTVRSENAEVVLPIKTGPQGNTIVVPSRCEVFRIFKINNFSGPSFIEKKRTLTRNFHGIDCSIH